MNRTTHHQGAKSGCDRDVQAEIQLSPSYLYLTEQGKLDVRAHIRCNFIDGKKVLKSRQNLSRKSISTEDTNTRLCNALPWLVLRSVGRLLTAAIADPWPCKVTTHWDWWRAGHSGNKQKRRLNSAEFILGAIFYPARHTCAIRIFPVLTIHKSKKQTPYPRSARVDTGHTKLCGC